MTLSSQLTTQWKDASLLDQRARQIHLFLFPDRRPIARLKLEEVLDGSLTLWREAERYVLVYLTPHEIKADGVAIVLSSLEEMASHGIAADQSLSNFLINIFAKRFEPGFLARLQFLSIPVETYEWSASDENQKETVLVKEIFPPSRGEIGKKLLVNGNAVISDVSYDPLTSEELAAFVQLGMDLRKIRLSP
ncbi:MAG: hypothetical protein HY582_01420 [Candidatus Omnitrophica bacterium]|nr:hypothetical protein [Candidatus Omnitrophota bacterium]